MFVSGMGFFTDAYDLFVIGILAYLLTSQWNLSTSQISLLNSITLAASAVGALVFGRVADILLASGLSDNLTWRLLLGLGPSPGWPSPTCRAIETPRFAMEGGATEEAEAAIAAAFYCAQLEVAMPAGKRPAGPGAAQLSPGVWMSTPSTDGYFCRHC